MNKLRILNTSAQAFEMIWMLKLTNSRNQMVFMKSWTIEQYGACIGDDFDANNELLGISNDFNELLGL